ncbi:MAG TPA: cysteine desulfurase-like protein [Firmicutes bacterium]|nr:cysteine desulfurase-like protein [Candidatus Fermentithermobacillaceae bacterium]
MSRACAADKDHATTPLQKGSYDVQAIRKRFPALRRMENGMPVAFLDGPGGSQVVDTAIEAMANYLLRGSANVHGVFSTSVETDELILRARAAMADFIGGRPDEVAFGANMTTLNFALARAMARDWREGDEVVVTEMDHRANVDPWISAIEDRGGTVSWIKVDRERLTLDLSDLDSLIGPRTKVVAVGLASNVTGTVNDVRTIADAAHSVGACVVVDAVHAAPHIFIDRDALGADAILFSPYKVFGPHLGVLSIKADLYDRLKTYKVLPQLDWRPDKIETGTLNHEGIAGAEAAVKFIASLGEGETTRDKIRSAMEKIEEHENPLAEWVRERLRAIPGFTVYAAPDDVRKTPTIAWRVRGMDPRDVCLHALKKAIYIASGDFYATTLATILGIRASGSWVRAGIAPYTTREEVELLVESMEELAV